MDRVNSVRRDLKSQTHRNRDEFVKGNRNQERRRNAESRRDRRALLNDNNRNVEPALEQKLSYSERYKIWKQERDAKRKLEEEIKRKQRPVFKVGGAISTIKSQPVPVKKTTRGVNTRKIQEVVPQKSITTNKPEVRSTQQSDLVSAVQNLSVNAENVENENDLDESTVTQIRVVNERNEVIFVTPSSRVTRSKKRQEYHRENENKTPETKSKNTRVLTPRNTNQRNATKQKTNTASSTRVSTNSTQVFTIEPSPSKQAVRKKNNTSSFLKQNNTSTRASKISENEYCSEDNSTEVFSEKNTNTIEDDNSTEVLTKKNTNTTEQDISTEVFKISENNSLSDDNSAEVLTEKNVNITEEVTSTEVFTERNDSMEIFKTPEKDQGVPEFVGAFVTTSRGKSSAKKERLSRRSLLGYVEDDSPQHRRVQAGYYRKVLQNEITRLTSLHDEWHDYQQSNIHILTEDTIDSINTALGQTKLLIRSKFEQFRGLIEQSVEMNDEKKEKVTPTDLGAFWDMVFIQVENINMRFMRLAKLRENNWIEFENSARKVPKVKKNTTRPLRMKTALGSSRMKDIIRAGRKKHANNLNKSGTFVKISTPKTKCHVMSKVLRSQTPNSGKEDTPSKGILKTPGLNKSISGNKVFFRGSDCNEVIDFDKTLPAQDVRSSNDKNKQTKAQNDTNKQTKSNEKRRSVRQSINLISWNTPPDGDATPTNKRSSTPRNTRNSIILNKGVLS